MPVKREHIVLQSRKKVVDTGFALELEGLARPLNKYQGQGSPLGQKCYFRETVRPGDPEKIFRLVKSTGFFSEEETQIAHELANEALTQGIASGYCFLLMEQQRELVGYTCFGHIPGTLSSYDVYWIVVDPKHQKQGWGRWLLLQSERIMRKEGARQVYIETAGRSQYKPTRRFYEKQGYRSVADFKDFYAPGDDKIVYHKCLDC